LEVWVASTTEQLPELSTLSRRIRAALGDDEALVLDRRPHSSASSFPAEVVTCRTGDGSDMTLFCKHENGASDGSFGHRGGVAYEVEIYRHLLQLAGVSTPRFYGGWTDGTGNDALLVIEYMNDARLLKQSRDLSSSLVRAAAWIADFQRLTAQPRQAMPQPPAREYGPNYYLGWSQRAAGNVARAGVDCPWFEPVRDGFEHSLELLTGCERVPIHGEFYPHNVLVHGGRIRPIDWESAALAVGEIDLASLIERWPSAVTDACRAEYARTRWSDGPPSDFGPRLDMAGIYLHFRWIAARSSISARPPSVWRFDELRSIGERLGFLR
jgi:hypothetical protein